MAKVKNPFFKIKSSNELLTDRGGLALFDEYVQSTGILNNVDSVFPWPGSNRGISASSYFRVLGLHMFDGSRYLEEIRDLKDDKGFRKVLNLKHFPGPDAVGDWLRRHGEQAIASDYFDSLMAKQLPLYLKATSGADGYVLDMDASIVESDKGDGTMSYAGVVGYMPMLGLPDVFVLVVLGLLMIGFPIATTLSWHFQMTEQGLRRSPKSGEKHTPHHKPLTSNLLIVILLTLIVVLLVYPRITTIGLDTNAISQDLSNRIDPKSIAVLPFTSFTDDREDEIFADGMHDEAIKLDPDFGWPMPANQLPIQFFSSKRIGMHPPSEKN